MASLKQLKDKQESVKSIHKITSAMELVATAKSRNAIRKLDGYKEYYKKIEEIVQTLTSSKDYVIGNESKNNLWIIFSSDLGLAGGYNSNIFKLALKNIDISKDKIIVFGSKLSSSIRSKFPNINFKSYLLEDFNKPSVLDELTMDVLEDHYDNNRNIKVIYTRYISQIDFMPKIKQILPIKKENEIKETQFEFEPNARIVLKEMMDTYIPSILKGLYKESIASEHSSRRVAMENASGNGEELLSELKIEFNKKRQAKITQELSEISAGSEALK